MPATAVNLVTRSLHPDTLNYRDRVLRNGGAIRDRTLNSINRFVLQARSNNSYNECHVIMPFAGDNLAAALTPLKAPAGFTVTNHNFVSGDYSEATGLNPGTGNTTKYLSTNYNASENILGNSVHLSNYGRHTIKSGTYPICLGAVDLADHPNRRLLMLTNTGAGCYFDSFDAFNGRVFRGFGPALGLALGNRLSASDARFFFNGSQLGETTATIGGTIPNAVMRMFFLDIPSTPYEDRASAFMSWGVGISNQAGFYQAVQGLQAALGRVI